MFCPHAAERSAGESPGVGHPVPPAGNRSVETTGSPTFLGNPDCALALLFDPGRTDASGHAMRRRGPRSVHHEGSRIRTFEAQSHGFGTGCLRFAGRVAPTPRKTRFRLLAKLFRTGLVTRRVPMKGFELYPTSQPPFPSSTWRKDILPVSHESIRSRVLIDKRTRVQPRTAVRLAAQENAEQDAAGTWRRKDEERPLANRPVVRAVGPRAMAPLGRASRR